MRIEAERTLAKGTSHIVGLRQEVAIDWLHGGSPFPQLQSRLNSTSNQTSTKAKLVELNLVPGQAGSRLVHAVVRHWHNETPGRVILRM